MSELHDFEDPDLAYIKPVSREKANSVLDKFLANAESTPLAEGECHFITLRIVRGEMWTSHCGYAAKVR